MVFFQVLSRIELSRMSEMIKRTMLRIKVETVILFLMILQTMMKKIPMIRLMKV
jgi:hypothetical protein